MATNDEINKFVIAPMCDIWPQEMNSTKMKCFYIDLSKFSSGVLDQAFHEVRRNWKYSTSPKSSDFLEMANRIQVDNQAFSNEAIVIAGVRYLPAEITKRKHDEWIRWQKENWRSLSMVGMSYLKEWFFNEFVKEYSKSKRTPSASILIGPGVIAHFQMEYGSYSKPEMNDKDNVFYKFMNTVRK